ncbi:MAG: indolepyruvate oxidoreductase subunit beta [bacterium]
MKTTKKAPAAMENNEKKSKIDTIIAGVGGLGNILAAKIVSHAFAAAGYDVKQSEVHGMAQRGGAVSSHVRAGARVHSPLISLGGADFILSLEKMEALRYLEYASSRTVAIIGDLRIDPPSVASGSEEYPDDAAERAGRVAGEVVEVAACRIAREIGSERVFNSVLLGALAARVPVPLSAWEGTYAGLMSGAALETNLAAFRAGFDNQRFRATGCR